MDGCRLGWDDIAVILVIAEWRVLFVKPRLGVHSFEELKEANKLTIQHKA